MSDNDLNSLVTNNQTLIQQAPRPMDSKKTNNNSPDVVVPSIQPNTEKNQEPPKEIGGRKDGLDPTRFGDWEKNGRCIDF